MKKTSSKFYIILALCAIMPLIIVNSAFWKAAFCVIYPALIALVYKRKSPFAALICIVVGFIAVWFNTYRVIDILVLCCPAMLGVVLGRGFKIGQGFRTLIFRGTIAFIIPIIALMWIAGPVAISDYMGQSFTDVAEMMRESTALIEETDPGSTGTALADFLYELDILKSMSIKYIPAILIVVGIVCCYISIVLAKIFLKIGGLRFVYVPSFAFLRLDRSMTAFMMVSSMLAMLPIDEKAIASLDNIVLIMLALAFICGLSVIDFYVRQRIYSGARRFLLYSITLFIALPFSGMPIAMLCLIGIIDSFFKLRIVKSIEG